MLLPDNNMVIEQTKKWITDVVVGCNFCPFAAKELKRENIHYEVLPNAVSRSVLEMTMQLMLQLDRDEKIETSFLVLPGTFLSFLKYLDMMEMAESLLAKEKYEGVYQLAGFHPAYLFAGSKEEDPANYTNRSPHPMIHFLRESSVSKAIDSFKNAAGIPGRNIEFAHQKGLAYMQELSGIISK